MSQSRSHDKPSGQNGTATSDKQLLGRVNGQEVYLVHSDKNDLEAVGHVVLPDGMSLGEVHGPPAVIPSPNVVLKGDPDNGVGDLLIHRSGYSSISCWQLSEREIQQVLATGKIYLCVIGGVHPPVALDTDPLNLLPLDYDQLVKGKGIQE